MLDKKIVEEKILNDVDNTINHGIEGIILKASNNTVYKIFQTSDHSVLDNKYKKLLKLYDRNIDFFTNPISTLFYNNNFIGYEMFYESEYESLDDVYLNKEELVLYLKKIKTMILELEKKGITYTDLRLNNILINQKNREIKFCDVDNISIDNLSSDTLLQVLKNIDLEKYPDFDIHTYLHNLLVIREVIGFGKFEATIANLKLGLQDEKYIKRDFGSEGVDIVKEMIEVENNPKVFSKRYLIDKIA